MFLVLQTSVASTKFVQYKPSIMVASSFSVKSVRSKIKYDKLIFYEIVNKFTLIFSIINLNLPLKHRYSK